ncbi:hypothetical protein MJO55_20595 [Mycolicibacterium rufum]|uniref:Pyridoxamine 5'-phosphate oxidase n=1 Tax=Mycolicibacterium rufum TaxID=318424 RepID=A0ABY3U7Q1_9MYCO|nr:hypothetical protein [Mycolicibacterium rufum]KGI69427.1 hypothetical protein EU78_20545 [Mycolicibacterium rufum]ULP35634.1 hypothetical protein MJO55_20595 [Mycolicibacterium rufum]
MWAEAAKRLSRFPEAVLTALDADGYPTSVRVPTRHYDAGSGELYVKMPDRSRVAESPANLLCHSHDEKLWRLDSTHVRGRLERRDDEWVFVSESFMPPSRLQIVAFLRGTGTSAQKYLDRRGLARPTVNWAAVKEVRQRAKRQRTP